MKSELEQKDIESIVRRVFTLSEYSKFKVYIKTLIERHVKKELDKLTPNIISDIMKNEEIHIRNKLHQWEEKDMIKYLKQGVDDILRKYAYKDLDKLKKSLRKEW